MRRRMSGCRLAPEGVYAGEPGAIAVAGVDGRHAVGAEDALGIDRGATVTGERPSEQADRVGVRLDVDRDHDSAGAGAVAVDALGVDVVDPLLDRGRREGLDYPHPDLRAVIAPGVATRSRAVERNQLRAARVVPSGRIRRARLRRCVRTGEAPGRVTAAAVV